MPCVMAIPCWRRSIRWWFGHIRPRLIETVPATGHNHARWKTVRTGAFAEYPSALMGVSVRRLRTWQAQSIGRVSAIGVFGVALDERNPDPHQ